MNAHCKYVVYTLLAAFLLTACLGDNTLGTSSVPWEAAKDIPNAYTKTVQHEGKSTTVFVGYHNNELIYVIQYTCPGGNPYAKFTFRFEHDAEIGRGVDCNGKSRDQMPGGKLWQNIVGEPPKDLKKP